MTAPSLEMLSVHEPDLTNLLGHAAGALIFGIFLVLLLRETPAQRLRGSRLTLLCASLALVWNTTSLIIAAARPEGWIVDALVVVGASALSLLPALLLHISMSGRPRPLVAAGYLLSAVAVGMHVSELRFGSPEIHHTALNLTAFGFALLTLAGAARDFRSRAVGAMALLLLSLSFAHFRKDSAHSLWILELIVHHASIPLSLFVLLKDYRFLVLDAFIRFLANILLAAFVTFAGARAAEWFGWWRPDSLEARTTAAIALAACAALVGYALLRGWLQSLLTRLVFRRQSLDAAVRELNAPAVAGERAFLDAAALTIARYFGASSHAVLAPGVQPGGEWDALAPVLNAGDPISVIALGRRTGGRRYLSEDLAALSRLTAVVEGRMQAFREAELRQLAAEAEMRALQSQIHPHFLFNAFNTLYGIIPRNAEGARRTVLNLAEIFRYFLRNDRGMIVLEEELRIAQAYLDIERLRFGDKLTVRLECDEDSRRCSVPSLSVQPLIENAVKHGVAQRPEGGCVGIETRVANGRLEIVVSDPGGEAPAPGEGAGVAMENVRRRLELRYGSAASLHLVHGEHGVTVTLSMPAEAAVS
jgi:hypothetical protein